MRPFFGLFEGRRPPGIGANGGRLAPPPRSPNCASSACDPADAVHYVAPLAFRASADEAWSGLLRTLRGLDRVSIVTERSGYLHAEFRSRMFGFVDDVEFVLDVPAGVIQVRSASRLGHGDLGVNRRRVEMLRTMAAL